MLKLAFLTSTFLLFSTSVTVAEGAGEIKLSAGLEASDCFAGRSQNGTRITTKLQLVNKSTSTILLLLVGQRPLAVDNAGASYGMVNYSGVAGCSYFDGGVFPGNGNDMKNCIGIAQQNEYTISLEEYTTVDAGTQATITFAFDGDQGTGAIVSFAATLAYRIVIDPVADEALSDEKKRKSIRTLNVSFPDCPITAAE